MPPHLILRKPIIVGGGDIDLTDFTGRRGTPFFDGQQSLMELGHRYDQGSASQGEFKFLSTSRDFADEPFASSFPLGHQLLTLFEDAPGFDCWLFRGRVAVGQGGRGTVKIDGEVSWDITADDGNVDLRGQGFTETWSRPEETDTDRIYALQAYTLNNVFSTAPHFRETCNVIVSPSAPHLAPDTNTVTMPARNYPPGTQPEDVIRDCAETAGKLYGVVIHHDVEDSGQASHLCLLYILPSDHTTYATAAKICDVLAEWDPDDPTAPVLEPHWERGAGTTYQYQTILSGMVGIWSPTQATFVENTGTIDQYDYWVEAYNDDKSQTSGQSAARTAALLTGRDVVHINHNVSVILNPSQVHLLTVGMSILVKTSVTGDPTETYVTRRIAELRWEPMLDGRYWAHLSLVNPPLILGPSTGSSAGVVGNQVSVLEAIGHQHINAETPTGTIDGANDTFTLADAPDPPDSLQLFKNGTLQLETVDYTLAGDTITYEAGSIPDPGDLHLAYYRTP